MTGFEENQVWLGTWANVWIDGDLMAECTAFRAQLNVSYEDVQMARKLMKGKKVTGIEGEGEIKMHKVSSYILQKTAADIKKGIVPDITIESSIQDPSGIGEERVAVKHVKFEKIPLADWERGNLGSEDLSFSFSDYDTKNLAV